MTDDPLLEPQASGDWGRYFPHCFFIRASIEADLEPPSGVLSQNAVAIHAHEYTHMLHNVSTCAGLHLLVANMWLLRLLPHATDHDGHFRGVDFLAQPQRTLVKQAYDWFRALFGAVTWKYNRRGPLSVKSWQFGPVKETQHTVLEPLDPSVIDLIGLEGVATDRHGTEHPFCLQVGYNFISEGVAHEVDREIRRRAGVPETALDADPALVEPYLMFVALLEHWVGRPMTAAERIDLGVYALFDTCPGKALWLLSQVLGKEAPRSAADGRISPSIANGMLAHFNQHIAHFFYQFIKPEVDLLGRVPSVRRAAADLARLIENGLALRQRDPVFEHMLLSCHDTASFHGCVGRLLDCCVSQAKASGRFDLHWIGPGYAGRDQVAAEDFARLQAAMHFAQRHFHPIQGLLPTSALDNRECPFSGACQQQIDEGHPFICETTPWLRFSGPAPAKQVCWYAGGVKILARARHPAYTALWL